MALTACLSPAKPTIKIFSNENYLEEPQDTEFKRTTTNFFFKFLESKEDGNKHSIELQERTIHD